MTLDALRDGAPRLVPLEALVPEFPAVSLDAAGRRRMSHGQTLRRGDWISQEPGGPAPGASAAPLTPGGWTRVFGEDGALLGVAVSEPDGALRPSIVLI